MPEIGEVHTAKEIGLTVSNIFNKYIWYACEQCGQERWVLLRHDKPQSKICRSCTNIILANAGHNHRISNEAKSLSVIARFLSKIAITDSGCWEWQGSTNGGGYGLFHDGNNYVRSHRWAYEHFNNTTIPDDLQIDHLCRNRKCNNPEHLEVVTRKVNVQRGIASQQSRLRALARTHCYKGHPYDDNNTYKGYRYCRICKAALARKRYAERKGS